MRKARSESLASACRQVFNRLKGLSDLEQSNAFSRSYMHLRPNLPMFRYPRASVFALSGSGAGGKIRHLGDAQSLVDYHHRSGRKVRLVLRKQLVEELPWTLPMSLSDTSMRRTGVFLRRSLRLQRDDERVETGAYRHVVGAM